MEVSELVGALMGMTLIALASAALANPVRSPSAATSDIAASPSRHRPTVASAVIVPLPRSQRPSRRSAGRHCVAASAADAQPPRSLPAGARRNLRVVVRGETRRPSRVRTAASASLVRDGTRLNVAAFASATSAWSSAAGRGGLCATGRRPPAHSSATGRDLRVTVCSGTRRPCDSWQGRSL